MTMSHRFRATSSLAQHRSMSLPFIAFTAMVPDLRSRPAFRGRLSASRWILWSWMKLMRPRMYTATVTRLTNMNT